MKTAKAAQFYFLGVALICGSAGAGLSVDENTGEARFGYDLNVPLARGKYQPSLSLQYGSSNRTDSGYGFGWSVGGDWIEVVRPPGSTSCCVGYKYVYVHNGTRR